MMSALRRHSVHPWAVVGGTLLSLLAGVLALKRAPSAEFRDLLAVWIAGVVSFVLGFGTPPALSLKKALSGGLRWASERRWRLMGLAALLAAALVVRTFDLEHIPANLGGDEGTWGMEALAMTGERWANPFSTRWFAFPSMSFLAWGLSMRLLGETVAGLRTLSALIGTATVLTTFLMAHELWGRRVAWLTAALLSFGHFHLHFSRLAVNNIADGLFITLSLWLIILGLRSGKAIRFALAGVVIGAGWYGYFGARLIGVVVLLFLAWRALSERGFLARYRGLLIVLVGGVLVTVAPLLLYYVAHPGALAARSRQVSIFASGWLVREQQITGRSGTSLLLEQLLKSISAFNYTLDPTFWYRPEIPLLDPIGGGLLILGLLWTGAHWRRPVNGLLLLWFWLAVLLGWVVTENPPSSMRLVIVAPALALLGGLGLNWLIGVGQRTLLKGHRLWGGVAAVVVCAAAFLNARHYFVDYTPTRVYGNPTAEVATELGRFLAPCDQDYEVHFYGPPFIYWDFGTLRFLARGCTGVDVPPIGEGEPAAPDLSRGVRFVFLPERLGELEGVRSQYPAGVETSVNSVADGRLLYVLYEVQG
jgi:hypothetical protein